MLGLSDAVTNVMLTAFWTTNINKKIPALSFYMIIKPIVICFACILYPFFKHVNQIFVWIFIWFFYLFSWICWYWFFVKIKIKN